MSMGPEGGIESPSEEPQSSMLPLHPTLAHHSIQKCEEANLF